MNHPYIIGHFKSVKGSDTWINYYPVPHEFRGDHPRVTVFYGSNPSRPQGPCLKPAEMLEFVMGRSVWKQVDGKMKHFPYEYDPPGWFKRQCEAASCMWFYAMVERMAAGENIPIDEIESAYRENNGGKKLEQKPLYEMQ